MNSKNMCEYLFQEASSFLKFANWHYYRFGTYIEDLKKLAILIVSNYREDNIVYDDFLKKYNEFFKLEFKQFSEFYLLDTGKRLEEVK